MQKKIIQALAIINSNTRRGNRAYNEMYISNPNKPMAVFAYPMDESGIIGHPLEFLRGTAKKRTEFLQQYARNNDLPFVLFGH